MKPTRTPCVPAPAEPGACIAALLHGARCCTDRSCASCSAERLWLVRSGYPVERILRREWIARTERAPSRCPICRCPPPTPTAERPAVEPLDRSNRTRGGAYFCAACGRRLSPHQRRYCDDACRRDRRRLTEGSDALASHGGKRVHRVR